jgi:serine/threonine protein kinase
VWLARDTAGDYWAVKLVFRHRFPNGGPYEREFKGLQNYTPFSRLHPGWIQIRSVGRDDAARYFFCVMEPADDEVTGRRIDPATYVPKTLARMVRKQKRLPLASCVEIGLALTAALEHLHQHSLIHRDIKPSNVIFAHGTPKFADIGLITEMRSPGRDVSYLGTDGYMAPEGPGTPASDLYSLGKLLYEISMGRDRREFPELPATLVERVEEPAWRSFHEILFKACEIQPRRRYQSSAQLNADLVKLKSLIGGNPLV